MENVCPQDKCTGCTACMNVCAHHAIIMQPDACGFAYPIINKDICVNCGLCVKTCPVNNPLPLEAIKECYAATVKDEEELLSCSSGGIATAFSQYTIRQGGVVYGCSGTNPRHVRHIRVKDMNDIDHLKESKYVQSDLGDSFIQIKADLERFPMVLFIGTPCQVAGLKSFLYKDYSNLITIDLVCHGVPSQKMLNDNLRCYCSDDESANVSFRRKNVQAKKSRIEFGWGLKGKQKSHSFRQYNKDYYMFGFLRCLTFRENCYSCLYAQNNRIGDLTLCDFWGLQADAGFVNGKGVSAVLVNTKKGADLFDKSKEMMVWLRREIREATRWNDQLNSPCEKPQNYDKFIESYSKIPFRRALRKAYYSNYLYDCYTNYKNCLKRFLYKYKLMRL